MTVDVTLEEIYNGSRREVSYEKQVLGLDGRTTKKQKASVSVYVKPGMQSSQKLKVRGEGNQQAKLPPTDLNICFKLVPSAKGSNAARFERKADNNLIYRHTLTLNDALQCRPIKMVTLDGRKLLVPVDQIPSPGSVKVLEGEGLVCHDDTAVSTLPSNEQRGDLYILFDIQFPRSLPGPEQRDQLI